MAGSRDGGRTVAELRSPIRSAGARSAAGIDPLIGPTLQEAPQLPSAVWLVAGVLIHGVRANASLMVLATPPPLALIWDPMPSHKCVLMGELTWQNPVKSYASGAENEQSQTS